MACSAGEYYPFGVLPGVDFKGGREHLDLFERAAILKIDDTRQLAVSPLEPAWKAETSGFHTIHLDMTPDTTIFGTQPASGARDREF